MPSYNHSRRGVVEQTRDHVELNQEGDFHCHHSPCWLKYIGRSSLAVQQHFEDVHGFDFGSVVFDWLPGGHQVRNHALFEGVA